MEDVAGARRVAVVLQRHLGAHPPVDGAQGVDHVVLGRRDQVVQGVGEAVRGHAVAPGGVQRIGSRGRVGIVVGGRAHLHQRAGAAGEDGVAGHRQGADVLSGQVAGTNVCAAQRGQVALDRAGAGDGGERVDRGAERGGAAGVTHAVAADLQHAGRHHRAAGVVVVEGDGRPARAGLDQAQRSRGVEGVGAGCEELAVERAVAEEGVPGGLVGRRRRLRDGQHARRGGRVLDDLAAAVGAG